MPAQNGYIQKIRGKGSIVLNREEMQFPVSGLVSFKELAQMLGKETKTTVHKFGLETPSELLDLRVGGNERRLPAAARFFCLVSKLILSNKNVRTFTFYHNGYNRDESNQKERCLTWQM